jgi:hypothetical protein
VIAWSPQPPPVHQSIHQVQATSPFLKSDHKSWDGRYKQSRLIQKYTWHAGTRYTRWIRAAPWLDNIVTWSIIYNHQAVFEVMHISQYSSILFVGCFQGYTLDTLLVYLTKGPRPTNVGKSYPIDNNNGDLRETWVAIFQIGLLHSLFLLLASFLRVCFMPETCFVLNLDWVHNLCRDQNKNFLFSKKISHYWSTLEYVALRPITQSEKSNKIYETQLTHVLQYTQISYLGHHLTKYTILAMCMEE